MGDGRRNGGPAGIAGSPAAAPLVATRLVDVPAPRVFDLLDDLGNHDWIGGRWLDVVAVDRSGRREAGAELVLRRPFLPDRRAVTTVERRDPPTRLSGTVVVPGVAAGRLDWALEPSGDRTRIVLTVTPLALRRRDRVWLVAGGRRWLDARLDAMLARLEGRLRS